MLFRSRSFFILSLVLLVGIGFLAPGEAQACIWGLGWLCEGFAGAIFGIIWIIGYLFGYLIALFGSILEYLIKAGNVGQAEAVKAAWVAVRDLANLFFGMGMVVIALATIFRLEGYGWKRALPRLIIAALLINFSFVIAGTIIDIGNIFSFFFLNQFTGAKLGPSIADALGVQNFLDLKKVSPGGSAGAGAGVGAAATLIFTVVLMAVTAITFGVGIVFLFVRIFMLWLLIVLSPIIWIAWVFPGTESYWKKWWETFLKWVFFAPIYVFMIWLALFIITSKATITQIITSEVTATQGLQNLAAQNNNLLTTGTTPTMIMQFGFMAMMMFGAIYVAQMGGMYGAQVGMKLAQGVPKGLSKLGLRATDRWLARGAHGPRVLPRISKFAQKHGWDKVAKWTEKTIGEKITSGLGEKWKKKYGEKGAEERLKRMDWWRRTIPTLASPAAMKRAYAAISARMDEVSYAGAGGRLQDAWYGALPERWGGRESGYEEREIEALEHAMSKEIETSTTEEQLSADINELLQKVLAGDKQAQATLIAALDKDVPLNGLNTMIASLPQEFKEAMKEASIDIAEKHKIDTAAKVAGVRTGARTATAEAVSERAAAAALPATDPAATEHIAKAEDLERRALALKNQADEMKAISDDGGEIDKQIAAIERGNVHQGFFLRAFLNRTLGDTSRAARVANDIGVNARNAGNHSFSGVSKFNTETGEFEWNDYYGMKSATAGQFRKGQPQLTMRMFHPDFFMRDESGSLGPTLSTQGLSIITDGMTFNHIREIHQMRPETSENFMNNFEAINNQFTDPEDQIRVAQIVGNLLIEKEKQGGVQGKYWIEEISGRNIITTKDSRGTTRHLAEVPA